MLYHSLRLLDKLMAGYVFCLGLGIIVQGYVVPRDYHFCPDGSCHGWFQVLEWGVGVTLILAVLLVHVYRLRWMNAVIWGACIVYPAVTIFNLHPFVDFTDVQIYTTRPDYRLLFLYVIPAAYYSQRRV